MDQQGEKMMEVDEYPLCALEWCYGLCLELLTCCSGCFIYESMIVQSNIAMCISEITWL